MFLFGSQLSLWLPRPFFFFLACLYGLADYLVLCFIPFFLVFDNLLCVFHLQLPWASICFIDSHLTSTHSKTGTIFTSPPCFCALYLHHHVYPLHVYCSYRFFTFIVFNLHTCLHLNCYSTNFIIYLPLLSGIFTFPINSCWSLFFPLKLPFSIPFGVSLVLLNFIFSCLRYYIFHL